MPEDFAKIFIIASTSSNCVYPACANTLKISPALAQASLQRLAEQYSAPPPKVSSDALALLMNYSFPGNVRELENFLERAFTLCEGNLIRPEDLQLNQLDELRMGDVLEVNHARAGEHSPTSADPELNHQPTQTPIPPSEHLDLQAVTPTELLTLPEGISLEHYLESIERILIAQALDTHRWNKTSTAQIIRHDLSCATLQNPKIEFGITYTCYRPRL